MSSEVRLKLSIYTWLVASMLAVCLFSSCNVSGESSAEADAELLARANAAMNDVTINDSKPSPSKVYYPVQNYNPKPRSSSPPIINNPNTSLRSVGGILTIPPALNARVVRAQVIHTRNGYHPAFDVSGAKGVGVASGFQWINFGKNANGVYNAGKPLSAYPSGKLGGAVWLISGDRSPPFAADGNLVVSE